MRTIVRGIIADEVKDKVGARRAIGALIVLLAVTAAVSPSIVSSHR